MRESEYCLALIENASINNVRSLTKEEFESISQEIDDLENFHHEDALFNLVSLNFNDFEIKTESYLNQYIADSNVNFSSISLQFLDLNRLILNLLSSIRTYLDYTETNLKRTFGGTSIEYEQFKNLTSKNFDNSFAYRFLSKLRNYSQHCGLPVGRISFNDDKSGHSLEVSLVRDSLLKNYDSWGAIVKPELEKQNDEFDIISLLREMTFLLKDVNKEITLIRIEKIRPKGYHLLDLLYEIQEKGDGEPLLFKISESIDNPTMEMKWFPYETISTITGVAINTTK